MTHAGPESHREPGSALSLKHLFGTALLLGCVSLGAVLLNASSWGAGSINILWPSTGLLIGILLCLPRKQWPIYIAVGFVIDLTVNVLTPPVSVLPVSLYLAGCNVIEVSLAAWLLKSTLSPQSYLTRSGQLIRLLAYGVILAPAIASFFAAFCLSGSFGKPTLHAFSQWFTGDALGDSIVIPLYLGLQKHSPSSKRSLFEFAFLFALLCAISILVFQQTSFPFLFVILPFLLLVEVRFCLAGSALGLLAVSVIGGYFTSWGRGPIALIPFESLSARTLTLQFFTFVCVIVLYIMELMLAERSRAELNLRASEQRFRLLAEESHDIIMLYNLQRDPLYASPAVEKLFGWEPERFLTLGPHQFVHPDDLTHREKLFEECQAGKTINTLDYRCKGKAGRYIWVEAKLVLYRDSQTGEPGGFMSVVRDISSRKVAEDELNKALNMAESLASIDALTGVANRRSFDAYLESEWHRGIRARTPISILMIDVDHFKRYNDIYGHVSGDCCLKKVVGAIASGIHRPTDLLARYGGEEFVVILPDTDASGAQSIAEQIRSTLAQLQIPHEGNPHRIVTISIGCATQIPKLSSLCTQLIESADEALYQAKSAGRNCARW